MKDIYPVVQEELVDLASRLVSTPSVSGDEGAAINLVSEEMHEAGFDSVEIDDLGNAVARIGNGTGPKLLIDGHVDTIPPHSIERWTVDPFAGEVRKGRLYGLGSCDMKSSIAAALHGVKAARQKLGVLPGQVALVASVNEEDMEGATLERVARSFDPDYVIIGEPNDTRLCIGQRGRAKIGVEVGGRACHAGHAREGLNAAEALATLITQAQDTEHPTHPRLGARDLNCIDMTSWPFPSVSTIPGMAKASFDARFPPGETPETLVALLEDIAKRAWSDWNEQPELEVALVEAQFTTHTGTQFSLEEYAAAWWTEPNSILVNRAQAALSEIDLEPGPTHYSFCTNGSTTAGLLGIPTIGFGAGEEHMAHQIDENVSLESLTQAAQGFAALVEHLVGRG